MARDKKKVHLVTGDVVQFVLSPVAKYTKGNYFEATVVKVLPKKFSLIIKPSAAAAKKLGSTVDSRTGCMIVEFRCCRVKSIKAHKELLRMKRRMRAERKRQQFQDSLKALERKHGGGKSKVKKAKAKKDHSSNWKWAPTS
jgi:hypothetical protein